VRFVRERNIELGVFGFIGPVWAEYVNQQWDCFVYYGSKTTEMNDIGEGGQSNGQNNLGD
jgi:hypothetical protein